MQFEYRKKEIIMVQDFTEQRGPWQRIVERKAHEYLEVSEPIALFVLTVGVLVQDIKSFILQLLALQLSVICAQDFFNNKLSRLLNFPKYPAKLHLYHEIFIIVSFTCSVHFQLKKRLSLFPRDFFRQMFYMHHGLTLK